MFAQVIQAKATDAAGLSKQMDKWREELMPGAEGFLGSTGGVAADGEFITLARFESEESARRNSDRPEQSAWWSETEGYLEDVRFYDSTDIEMWGEGGSDDAGFVQVMQGVAQEGSREKLRAFEEGFERNMSEMRPDLMGSVSVWQGNNFSTFNYFTSEAEAREGEKKETPEDMREGFETWQASISDVKFIDLTEPRLVSK
jgi:hypothetical protein